MKPFSILIVGDGDHGKDTFAMLLASRLNIRVCASSEFACKEIIFPWCEAQSPGKYLHFLQCHEDRRNHRTLWYNLIKQYNTPDKTKLARSILKGNQGYIGMRSQEEFDACMEDKLFEHVLWVDASDRKPPESSDSNTLRFDPKLMSKVDNNGPLDALPSVADRWANTLLMRHDRLNGPRWPRLQPKRGLFDDITIKKPLTEYKT